MKVLIKNKFKEEIKEVDEKFRDMFPMKEGCKGIGCIACPFNDIDSCSELEIYNFTAEIVLAPKKKVTKAVDLWVLVNKKDNIVDGIYNGSLNIDDTFVKVKLSGSYTVEE